MVRGRMAITYLVLLALPTLVHAGVVDSSEDFDEWSQQAGQVTTIGFTDLPSFTLLDDQYADLGVTFPGTDSISGPSSVSYPQDGWGVNAAEELHVVFDQPQTAIGAHHISAIAFQLYSDGELVYQTPVGEDFHGGPEDFAGLVSSVPFDEAFLYKTSFINPDDPGDFSFAIDNFYFNNPVPGPASIALFGAACLFTQRRRRNRRNTQNANLRLRGSHMPSPRRAVVPVLSALSISLLAATAHAEDQTFEDFNAWSSESQPVTTIDFDMPPGTFVVDQYSDEGVIFPGYDITDYGFYAQDNLGLSGFEEIHAIFDSPRTSIGMHFPSIIQVELFNDGELIYDSGSVGAQEIDNFFGVVTEQPFDRALISDPQGFPPAFTVNIDNLYFGPPVPAPGALTIFAASVLLAPGRKRRRA